MRANARCTMGRSQRAPCIRTLAEPPSRNFMQTTFCDRQTGPPTRPHKPSSSVAEFRKRRLFPRRFRTDAKEPDRLLRCELSGCREGFRFSARNLSRIDRENARRNKKISRGETLHLSLFPIPLPNPPPRRGLATRNEFFKPL